MIDFILLDITSAFVELESSKRDLSRLKSRMILKDSEASHSVKFNKEIL